MHTPFRLLDLPNEILFLTAEYLESCRRDLRALACVCVRISEIAERYYYRHVLLRSEDQFRRFSSAMQRKPQRLAYIQDVVLVPAAEHTTELTTDLPHFLLVSANMLQRLTVELPFQYDEETAASLNTHYYDRLGELFEDASVVGDVPKPRPFRRLRSCKLNFQYELARPWSLGKYSMLFLHETLQSLTLVGATLGPEDVGNLKHQYKLTPLSRLHLDHCEISLQALDTILSVPRALLSLELTEYCYRGAFEYALDDHEELAKALGHQENSLHDLHLGLRLRPSVDQTPYDFCKFTSLQKVTVEYMGLDNLLYNLLTLEGRKLQITLSESSQPVFRLLLPRRPLSFVIQTPPGYRFDVLEDCMAIEGVGSFLKRPHDDGPQSVEGFETRLIIVRQTEPRGAVPPYLYGEHVPEKVICYDSYAPSSNWGFRTDNERQTEEDIRRLRDPTPFPDMVQGDVADVLLGQLDSA